MTDQGRKQAAFLGPSEEETEVPGCGLGKREPMEAEESGGP